jgi:hypothetical protein
MEQDEWEVIVTTHERLRLAKIDGKYKKIH